MEDVDALLHTTNVHINAHHFQVEERENNLIVAVIYCSALSVATFLTLIWNVCMH